MVNWIVAIPYIVTKAELSHKKSRIIVVIGILLAVIIIGLAAVNFFVRPLDELWDILSTRLLNSWYMH